MAGEAAFCTNDFDLAEKYLKVAADAEPWRTAGILRSSRSRPTSTSRYYKVQWAKEKRIREAEAKADDLPRGRSRPSMAR